MEHHRRFRAHGIVWGNILKTEVRGRLLRLFPVIDAATFAAVSSSVVSESALCALFDSLSMKSLVGAKPDGPDRGWSLTARQRSNMLCAIVGEMSWFAARTRAMDRTHNNALFPPSDALILHVLCCHVLESIPAELLYAVIEPKVRRIKEVWVNQPMSLPEQLRLKPRTIGALSLSLQPCSITEDERARKAQASLAPVCRPLLFQERVFGSVRSTMRPRFNYKRFDGRRYQILAGDTRCDAPLMPSPRPRGSSEPVTVQMPDERRRELLQLAIDRGKR
ncbi:hypothetical protein TRVL_02113 [Trypanosoma vivax]|nr:hypothetical protein TRVL_02113 [Trypanosoma vivax]